MEEACLADVRAVCDGLEEDARKRHWQRLLRRLAPELEAWALANRVLRGWKLDNEDDARAVMVGVIERLFRDDFANLRRFLDRQHPREAGGDEADEDRLLGMVAFVNHEDADDTGEPAHGDTPLRAWLLTLVSFVAKDHLRARLGWSFRAGDGEVSRRDIDSGAAPLSAVTGGVRPPMTDRLVARQVAGEVDRALAEFPAPMRAAWSLWLEDRSFGEIAGELGLDDAGAARKLVRAAQARLRSEFRARWPELVAA